MRTMFSDMKDVENKSRDFENAVKLVGRCVDLYDKGEFGKDGNSGANKYVNC